MKGARNATQSLRMDTIGFALAEVSAVHDDELVMASGACRSLGGFLAAKVSDFGSNLLKYARA